MKSGLLLCTHLSLQLVLILASADLTVSISSCPTHCGNISVPYPFGIGTGCYLSEWFAIQCNNSTSGELVPYLPKINKEVVNISLPDRHIFSNDDIYGSLRIKTNITSMGCSNSSDQIKFGEPLNFTGSPFTIGRSNTLQAIGCNYRATLTHLDPTVVGCIPTCEPRMIGDHTRCDGNKCCQANPPSGIGQIIGISIGEIASRITSERGCRVAFLTDENQDPLANREAKVTDPQWFYDRQYVILQLRWAIPMANRSFINSLKCTTFSSTSTNDPCMCVNNKKDGIRSVGCACTHGYTGNPFTVGGCKDIDECQLDQNLIKYCRGTGGTCVNTHGSFECVHKKDKTMPITIGLCVGFGVLIFFGVTLWLCKFIKKRRKISRKNKLFKRNGGLLLKQQLTSSTEGSTEKTKVFTVAKVPSIRECS